MQRRKLKRNIQGIPTPQKWVGGFFGIPTYRTGDVALSGYVQNVIWTYVTPAAPGYAGSYSTGEVVLNAAIQAATFTYIPQPTPAYAGTYPTGEVVLNAAIQAATFTYIPQPAPAYAGTYPTGEVVLNAAIQAVNWTSYTFVSPYTGTLQEVALSANVQAVSILPVT